MNKSFAILFGLFGMAEWYVPGFNGFLFAPDPTVSAGDGRIVAAIMWVGAAILWVMPVRKE